MRMEGWSGGIGRHVLYLEAKQHAKRSNELLCKSHSESNAVSIQRGISKYNIGYIYKPRRVLH